MSDFRNKHTTTEKEVANPPEKRLRNPSPQRQFTDVSSHVTSSLRLHKFLVVCYWLVPTLVILLIIVGGIVISFKLLPKPGDPEAREAYQPSFRTSSSRSFLAMEESTLLDAYVEAMGGRSALQEIRSVRVEGMLTDTLQERNFQLIISLPDKAVLVFEPGSETSERYILNGKTAWQLIEKEAGAAEVKRLMELETRTMMLTCRLHDPLLEFAMGGGGEIINTTEVIYDNVDCIKVKFERADGSIVNFYLDRKTLFLLAQKDTLVVDGESVVFEMKFGDYSMTAGVLRPHRVTTFLNTEFYSERALRSVQVNPSVMSSLFEVPEELRD